MTMKDATDRAKLEADAKRLGLTPNALEMSRAVGTDLIGDIVRDNRRSVHERSGIIPPQPSGPERPPISRNGWVDPAPLANGYNRYIEAQLDAQDALDRAERTRHFNRLPLNGGE